MLDRHTMRPAHIHFIVSAKNHKSLVTELFDRKDKYIANDTVFAVKESLLLDFRPLEDDINAEYSATYDFTLADIR
jgi:catechol 1,2-dioxygenase